MSETEHEEETEADEGAVSPSDAPDGEGDAQDAETPETPEKAAGAPAAASGPKSEKEIERALKSVEKAGTTYRNAVSRAMGEDAQALEPCPRCNAPVAGMIFPPDAAPLDDEKRESVLASLGMGASAEPPLRDAVGVKMCDRCDGHGLLKYPTRKPHVAEQNCPTCSGQGYVSAETATDNIVTFTPGTTTSATATISYIAPCPRCGAPNMDGQPHFCNPASATG